MNPNLINLIGFICSDFICQNQIKIETIYAFEEINQAYLGGFFFARFDLDCVITERRREWLENEQKISFNR